jgi:hypothetical protein
MPFRIPSRPLKAGLQTTQTLRTRPSVSIPVRCTATGSKPQQKIMLEDDKAFGFVRHNPRPPKPRKVGVTEIRGPYYSAMGKRYLEDVLET